MKNLKYRLFKILPWYLRDVFLYYKLFGKFPNLSNPQTFSEKIIKRKHTQCLKNSRYSDLADKYKVRNYVCALIGAEHLVPLVEYYSDANLLKDDILNLSNVVIKPNHCSGMLIFVEDYPTIEEAKNILKQAKKWLKSKAKGSERYGIIASAGARRLRAEGIDVKNKISPADWFLNSPSDVRSSYYLEDVATEFDIQGLEIDFSCLAWDINFYYEQGWQYQAFKGTCWQQIRQKEKQQYLLNAYRVLLTRARQGMLIYIPDVDNADWTRPKLKYDSTYQYLKRCGLEELS